MQNKDKTNKQFIKEVKQLRRRIAELEALETERKRANLLLQQEKETFFTILQHAPYGVVLVDRDGNHLYVNPAFTSNTGYTLEDIPTGKDWTHKAYPDKAYRQKVNEFWREDSKLGGKNRVLSVVCKDGETRQIEFSSVLLDDGRIVAMLVDITERKKMEEELRESAERFRLLVENSKDAFFLHEFGKIIDVNQYACDSLGYTREELLRLSIEDIDVDVIPGKHKDKWKQMVPGVPITLEGIQRRKDGTTFPIEVRLVAFESGGRTLMLGLSRDVTERKQAEDELQRAYDELKASKERERERAAQLEASNQELEAFSYSVSHDLRAPLRGIDGFSQALLEDYADQLDTQGKDYLHRVRAASQRLEHIIDDMLILSRVTRREMRRVAVNLSTMAQEIAAEFQANQPERQVLFVIAPGLVVKADPSLMRIALENLLDNAWKFTSKHPTARIEVGVTVNDGEHAYYVRDDGAGFNMAYVGKLFGAFQRLHPIFEFGGTGVGLATVQRIIHRHGGRVWAEGAVEQGATFHFTLPR